MASIHCAACLVNVMRDLQLISAWAPICFGPGIRPSIRCWMCGAVDCVETGLRRFRAACRTSSAVLNHHYRTLTSTYGGQGLR
jgi:hypothetical protein